MARPKEYKTCSIPGCSKPHLAKGYCNNHYQKLKIHGDPLGGYQRMIPGHPCLTEGCTKLSIRKGLCKSCYDRKRREERLIVRRGTCSIPECNLPHMAKGFCEDHYYRWKKYGDPNHPVKRLTGEGFVTKEGYKVVSIRNRRVFEHRKVMQDFLGRPLTKDENVHHRNGFRLDNRLENLELWSTSQPCGQRVADKLEWAHKIISLYEGLSESCVIKSSDELPQE